ncbi:OPT-domain-containing protein [Martensiomyces pterosporus]|nr:OPT-domain-containing protein [Martensiomyces pterosporus]
MSATHKRPAAEDADISTPAKVRRTASSTAETEPNAQVPEEQLTTHLTNDGSHRSTNGGYVGSDDEEAEHDVESEAGVEIEGMYLDTVNRANLDFDFEKLCSVSLSNINVYACLVCGKYYQGRGKQTHAYFHSINDDHHVFINLKTLKVYVLPDNYEVTDRSLNDIKSIIQPAYTANRVKKLDTTCEYSYDLAGKKYDVGFVGLNKIKCNDYMNAVVQALAHVPPIRDTLLLLPDLDTRSELVQRLANLVRKMWHSRLLKAHVSPHELVQEAGEVEVDTQALDDTKARSQENDPIEIDTRKGVKVSRVPFLTLSLDLPPRPLFTDDDDESRVSIPQVALTTLLRRYDGSTTVEWHGEAKRYRLLRLPQFIICHIKRFTRNSFSAEKNPTVVNFPIRNVPFGELLPKDAQARVSDKATYDLIANVCHGGQPSVSPGTSANVGASDQRQGSATQPPVVSARTHTSDDTISAESQYLVYLRHAAADKWYMSRDLQMEPIMPQMIFLSDSYIQIWQRNDAADVGGNKATTHAHAQKGCGACGAEPGAEADDNPFEEVRAVVGSTDDPGTPSLTFRVWVLGLSFLVIMSCVNQYYFFRDAPVKLSIVVVQIMSYPLGQVMAWALPTTVHTWRFGSYKWQWTLNPGPFSFKELVLATVFASSGSSSAYAIEVVVIKRKWFQADAGFWANALFCIASQLIGYGLAGMAQRLLVQPASMVWRENLVALSVFNSFFPGKVEHANGPYGPPRWTRTRFFWFVCGLSAVWYVVPGFLFQGLSSLSLLCIMFPRNQLLQIIGSGRAGLSLLSFTFDWNSVSNAYLVGPVSTPFGVACNIMLSFALFVWVVVPAVYFKNVWGSAQMPLYDYHLYAERGGLYNMSLIVKNGEFDADAYRNVGPIKISAVYALSYGAGFAGLTSMISYIALEHGRDIWMAVRRSRAEKDIHARLMAKYRAVPQWWFGAVLTVSCVMGLVSCQIFDVGLPWWGFLLSLSIPALFTIPVGYIQATTNIQPGLNIVTEMLIGFILPGRPVANMVFKVYGYITTTQALNLISDLKLGHYAKIPPRHMFIVQVTSTIAAVLLELVVAYTMMDRIPGICNGYPWSCRSASVFYNASILYGAIGPARMFLATSYRVLLWGFLVGLLLPIPIHLLQRKHRSIEWIQQIHVPVMLNFLSFVPVIAPLWVPAWFTVNFTVNYVVRKYRPAWFHHYSYALSAALDTGILVAGLVMNAAFTPFEDRVYWWGNRIDMCPLAREPWLRT